MPRKTLLVCFALLVTLLVPATSMGASPVDQYIVVLKDSADSGAVADQHKGRYAARVKHVYRHALRGYAAHMSARAAARSTIGPTWAIRVAQNRRAIRPTSGDTRAPETRACTAATPSRPESVA